MPAAQPLVSARMVPAYPATLSSLGRALSPLLASAGGGFFLSLRAGRHGVIVRRASGASNAARAR